jgi:hypothetical protein
MRDGTYCAIAGILLFVGFSLVGTEGYILTGAAGMMFGWRLGQRISDTP